MRPQERWNQKAGYISKSYKVNKTVADDFANSCKKNGVSQSGELFKFMSEYSRNSMKGDGKMRVRTRYSQDNECAKCLELAINESVYQYSEQDILDKQNNILAENQMNGKGDKCNNCLAYRKSFDIQNAKAPSSLEDFGEVVRYVKNIYLRDIALMRLIVQGKIMPIKLRDPSSSMELNIHHSHGNMIFTLEMDLLPFDVYVFI